MKCKEERQFCMYPTSVRKIKLRGKFRLFRERFFRTSACMCIDKKKCCVIISKLYKNLYEIYSALHSMDSRRFLPLTRLNPRSQSIIVIFITFTCREAFVSYFQHVLLLFKANIFLNFGLRRF